MSQITELLIKKAEEIRLSSPNEVAVEHIKQAGYSEADARMMVAQHEMEKTATETMVMAGVDVEKAAALVKAANINLKDLKSFKITASIESEAAGILKSAAAYIESLEQELKNAEVALEKAASEVSAAKVQTIRLPDPIEKLATSGAFTAEDLEALKAMNQDLLTKVASVADEPWEMGRGSGYSKPTKGDPLGDWILSDV